MLLLGKHIQTAHGFLYSVRVSYQKQSKGFCHKNYLSQQLKRTDYISVNIANHTKARNLMFYTTSFRRFKMCFKLWNRNDKNYKSMRVFSPKQLAFAPPGHRMMFILNRVAKKMDYNNYIHF